MSINELISDENNRIYNVNSQKIIIPENLPDPDIDPSDERYNLNGQNYNGCVCLNQLFRPKHYFKEIRPRDCRRCMPSKDNVECKDYYPIKTTRFDVEE